MYRFVALGWDARDPARTAAAARLAEAFVGRSPGWIELGGDVAAGLRTFHSGERAAISTEPLPAGAGAVFGTLFRSGSCGPRARLDVTDHGSILASDGVSLLGSHWGRYVAVVRRPSGRTFVLRDPTGGLPCWLARLDGVWILCSDVEDAVAMGLAITIHWPYLGALVAEFALQARATGLEQVTEVQPGELIELCRDDLVRCLRWEPLRIAASDPLEEPTVASAALREAARRCATAWASCHPRILHRLSGGLDSTIVLAALSDTPAAAGVTCLNYFGAGPYEDERAYARLAASHWRRPLIEQAHDPDRVSLEAALHAARTPRPYHCLYAIEHGRYEAALARSLGATALFSGDGGDGVFFRSGAQLAAADYLQAHGPGAQLLRVALDAAIIERASVWSILAGALRRRFSGDDARRAAPALAHPWLEDLRDAPPGKVRHVRSIGSPLPYYDPLGSDDDAESVQPLLSQPLIEVCLRTPTYTLVSGGWDRATARRAFERDVPPQILRRRAKGASTASVQRIFESNLPFLRETLLEGVLVRERLLDRVRLERALARGRSLLDTEFVPIVLEYLAIEAWLRRWIGYKR